MTLDTARSGYETTLGFPEIIDLYAQVVDASGAPVQNAHVLVKGTAIATTTDSNGIFSLSDIVNLSTIVISSVQGETVEMPAYSVGNKVIINTNTISVDLGNVPSKKSKAALYVIGGLIAVTFLAMAMKKPKPRKLAL